MTPIVLFGRLHVDLCRLAAGLCRDDRPRS
ncbi:putative leader peptide [Planomonospora corallina]|uniref:Leader peptide n=1 Tax=Planomonospora corallina TaxID=1806052 RepID=A0ABV8I8M9_9ACTN